MKQQTLSLMRGLKNLSWKRAFPWYSLVASLVGLNASLRLAIDTLEVLRNPTYIPSCDINPILSCGSVLGSSDGSFLGIPHPFLGIMAFTALLVFSVLLIAGTRFKEWIWRAALLAALVGVATVGYFVYESLFILGSLCPWCMTIWVAIIPLFFGMVSYVSQNKILKYKSPRLRQLTTFLAKENVLLQTLLFMLIAYGILVKFWYYWSTLL